MTRYVPWNKIFSYDADVTMLADSRGHGKTFGLREQFLRDAIKHDYNFVQIVRNETKIVPTSRGYFDALSKPNEDGLATSAYFRKHPCVFRRSGHDYLYQRVPRDAGPNWKPSKRGWERIGYFVSLSKAQDYKMMTFANVRRLCLDEALIENPDRSNNYVPNEFDRLVSLVDTCTRERADSGMHKPNVYLLSNSCGIVNPYFQHYGITTIPPDGFSWHDGKTFLLWIGNDTEYASEKARGTVAGRMSRGTKNAEMVNANRFVMTRDGGLIADKDEYAQFICGITCGGNTYGLWLSLKSALYYVNDKIPEDGKPIYALTTADNELNYVVASKTEPRMQSLIKMYRAGLVRFSSPVIREKVERDVFPLYGLR